MRNLLDSSKCSQFRPSFDNRECDFYQYAEDDQMNPAGECGFCKLPQTYRCVADITRAIPLSHSSVSDFLTCHYLYMLKKIIGVEVRPAHLSTPLKAGKLWDCTKQFHLGVKSIHDRDGAIFNSPWDVINHYEIDPRTVAKVRGLFRAYKELEVVVDPGFELQSEVNLNYQITLPPTSFIPSINIGSEAINLWDARNVQAADNRSWTFPLKVSGFYDRKYPAYFAEDKLSGRPEFYLDPFFIQSQCSTYFLADPNLDYCVMEVAQFPQQKELKKKEEEPDELMKRVYDAALSTPSRYFIGWDNRKRMYGVKFFRGEFDLEAAEDRYRQIVIEIQAARWSGGFYKNFKSCNNVLPGVVCDMRMICKNGNISEEMFKIKGK